MPEVVLVISGFVFDYKNIGDASGHGRNKAGQRLWLTWGSCLERRTFVEKHLRVWMGHLVLTTLSTYASVVMLKML